MNRIKDFVKQCTSKVSDFVKQCTSKVSARFKKITTCMATGAMTLNIGMTKVFADGDGDLGKNATMDGLMSAILNIIFQIFRYVGILLLVWSIAQIVMAFKNDDADSKQKGMMIAVISVVLITLSFVLKPILSSVGVNI